MSKETRAYNTKIIETSTYIEVYQYDEPISIVILLKMKMVHVN